MTLEEFLMQYIDISIELTECEHRLLELEWPQRGNKITQGEHAGVSNQPEEYAVLRDKLERQIKYYKEKLTRCKKRIEAFLRRLDRRTAILLRRKYIEGLNTRQLAAWMHVKDKSAIAAVKAALKKAEPEYENFINHKKNVIIKQG